MKKYKIKAKKHLSIVVQRIDGFYLPKGKSANPSKQKIIAA